MKKSKRIKACDYSLGKVNIIYIDEDGNFHTLKDGEKITLIEAGIKPIKIETPTQTK